MKIVIQNITIQNNKKIDKEYKNLQFITGTLRQQHRIMKQQNHG